MEGMTQAEAHELCLLAEEAWKTSSPNARKVRFKWRGRKFVSTLGLGKIHVDPDDGSWPRVIDGSVMHLTGGYGLGPWR